MEITGKLIEGVVELTKLMAHGAMHEACLIEVIKSTEDEAISLVKKVKYCTYRNHTQKEIDNYLEDNNATVIQVTERSTNDEKEQVHEMQGLLRKMLTDNEGKDLDTSFKQKLIKLQQDLGQVDENLVAGTNREEIADK